ncbi:MAG TPA: hypothetical protein VFE60_02630 [Roseiarcus sp.]|nr:hypothetical protein [Roseiarcus sp.]
MSKIRGFVKCGTNLGGGSVKFSTAAKEQCSEKLIGRRVGGWTYGDDGFYLHRDISRK